MAEDQAQPPASEPQAEPAGDPKWANFAALRLFRPLSAMAVTAPPECVKCGKPTTSCCDGTLAGEAAGFVPVCQTCYVGAGGKLNPEQES